MTIKLSSLKADLKREAEGDWIEYPDWKGVAFNVTSPLAPAFSTARDLKLQDIVKSVKAMKLPDSQADTETAKRSEQALGELFGEHILKDWRGLDEPYSYEKGVEICTKPEYRNVFNAVVWCSGVLSKIEIEFVEDELKNSGKPSATA
jgi:hypothetical protein